MSPGDSGLVVDAGRGSLNSASSDYIAIPPQVGWIMSLPGNDVEVMAHER